MNKIQELRAKIARGEVKTGFSGNSGPKVGEGTFLTLIESTEFSKGQSANLRGMIKCKVIGEGTPQEIGGLFNIYLQTTNPEFMESTIAFYSELLTGFGVDEAAIYADSEDLAEVIQNITSIIMRKLVKHGAKLVIKRKQQQKLDQNGRPRYYNDILLNETLEENAEVIAKIKGTAAAPTAKAEVAASTVEADVAALIGEATAAATAKAPTQKAKPW